MLVYTVTMPGGTKDWEFEAYTRLLEDVGIDVSNSPRVSERGSDRRWLYAWREQIEAERFASELRRRTRNADWEVHQFDQFVEERGPVAPLDIATAADQDGYTYYLTPASRERLIAAYPGKKLPAGLTVGTSVQQDFLREKGSDGWAEFCRNLTGLSDEEIDALGGVRVIVGNDTVVFQRIPAAALS